MSDSETKAVTGIVGIATENDTAFSVLGTVAKSIEDIADIPKADKTSVIKYITDNFKTAWDSVSELIDFIKNLKDAASSSEIPDAIIKYMDLILDALTKLL